MSDDTTPTSDTGTTGWITDSTPSTRFPFYTRANTGEVAPNPMSPLGWQIVWRNGTVRGYEDGHVRWGSFAEGELGPDDLQFACFGGYIYHCWSMVRVQGERSPGMSAKLMDDAFFGTHPDIPPYVAHPDDADPDAEGRIQGTMDWLMSMTELPDELAEDRAKALAARDARPDLAASTDAELVERATSMSPLIQEFFDPYMVYGTASSMAMGVLAPLCEGLDPQIPSRLIAGIGDVDSVPPSQAIWDLGRRVRSSAELSALFDAGLEGLGDRIAALAAGDDDGAAEAALFLADLDTLRHEHGARGPIEWDIASPTWETRPELVLALVDRLRLADDDLSPTARHARAVADREAAEATLRAHHAGDDEAMAAIDLGLRLARVFTPGRERTKLTEMMAIHEVRVAIDELGRRMVQRGIVERPSDITMLLDTELDAFVAGPASFADTISERLAVFADLASRQEPFILFEEQPDPSSWPRRGAGAEPAVVGDVLTGISGAAGIVTGTARIITDPSDPRGIEPGEILVAPITDPAWTPLFVTAGAVVVEVGAPMSHAMIVSRELGVPCVTGVEGATGKLRDGMLVAVDGGAGTVTILE